MKEWKKELKVLLSPYYFVNILLSLMFFISKTLPPICTNLYENCELEFKEYEMLIFLACIITIKGKRQVSVPNYLAHFCMFSKICNLVMFFQQSLLYAVAYGILWLLQTSFIHQPVYRGPDKITYFNEKTIEDELVNGDPRIYWLIEFYTAWSPACVSFAPIFAELSEEYGLSNLKFGKVDATRNPNAAQKYRIDASSWSKQLPTLILFCQGKEHDRRPAISPKGTVMQRFVYSWDSVVKSFNLNELYNECKKNPSQKSKQTTKKTEVEKKEE